MISYLPFTYIPADPFEPLAHALGPLAVHFPCPSLAPASIHAWQERGMLTLHAPVGLDEVRLLNRLQEFKNWAQLHDGHIGDMVDFFNTSQGRPPMVDELAPSQIRTQVRHFGEDVADTGEGELVQAALFLALAHEYDQHQERLGSDLAAVAGMEKAMFTTIGGGSDDSGALKSSAPGADGLLSAEDPGVHMTHQRLQAWSRVAILNGRPSTAYVTPSEAVFEYLKEAMGETVELPVWHLGRLSGASDLKQQRRMALEILSHTADIQVFRLDPALCGQPSDDDLLLEWVGCSGLIFDKFLPAADRSGIDINTVVGLARYAR